METEKLLFEVNEPDAQAHRVFPVIKKVISLSVVPFLKALAPSS